MQMRRELPLYLYVCVWGCACVCVCDSDLLENTPTICFGLVGIYQYLRYCWQVNTWNNWILNPKYFAPYLPLYKSAMNTRRSNPKNLFLQVPSYCASIHKSKVHFNNSFSYDAPKLWNDLPYDIRSAPNLSSFKSRLKTYLFQKSFPP